MLVYKQNLALNNFQGLICHKTRPNQIKFCFSNKGSPLEIVVSFYITCGRLQECVDRDGEHVETETIGKFWPFDPAKNAIQGGAPEGGDTFWWQL